MKEILTDADVDTHCDCGASLEQTVETQRFTYGSEPGVELSAVVPVMWCRDCDEAWTDWRGEDARQSAVDAHLASLKKAGSGQ